MIWNSKCNNILFSIRGTGIVPRSDHRNCYCDRKNKRNDSQGEGPRQWKIIRDNHFDPDKGEHEREPCSQVNETIHQAGHQKVERSQTEDRANIGSIGNKRITRDSEDRRNRIDRKEQVRQLDDDHGQGERGQHPAAIHVHLKVLVMKFAGNWKDAAAHPDCPILRKLARRMLSKQHSQRSEEEKQAKEIENEMKPLHQSDAADNHNSTHDKRAEDSPDQDAMLCQRRDAEMRENQYKHKDVIDAQRILDQVPGKKVEAVMRTFKAPHEYVKCE